MDKAFLRSISDRLQKERRALVQERPLDEGTFDDVVDSRSNEMQEHAQEERQTGVSETLDERWHQRIADIDDALARIDAGIFGKCDTCGGAISEERLRANPTTRLCLDCSSRMEEPQENAAVSEAPDEAPLPPDLDLLDDDELSERLMEIVREDGQVDMEELEITTHNGVVVLNGAVPSEAEHQILLNILTDVAGVQEIDDRLEIVRLAWERDDRSKNEAAQDVSPGTIPDQEPYGGTEDIVLTEEEGVTYEPPVNPPTPPYRKE